MLTEAMAKKRKKRKHPIRVLPAVDAGEAAAIEAARRAYREARRKLRAAYDPLASKEAYESVWKATDELGRSIIESVEQEEADEEPGDFEDDKGRRWKRVSRDACTYHTLRGQVRVTRSRYRTVRNGPTLCVFDERRGVMARNTMPELGAAILRVYAEVPAERASVVLEELTGHAVGSSRIKRVFIEEATAMKEAHEDFFEDVLAHHAIPETAQTLVISVDALSLLLREERWKQAVVASLTFLDSEGDPVAGSQREAITRLGEMPEDGKRTVMNRVSQEVAAIVAQRPDLALEVVIDGAVDLRNHLQARFPDARHITDFFHVAEHLADALRSLFPSDPARRAEERARWLHKLKHKRGSAFRLWRWLRDELNREDDPVSSWARREVEKHAEYIYRQREFTKYPDAIAAGQAIGSGVVEATCKTLVTQRLKISGASWSRPGAGALLYIRELTQSGRLEEALRYRHRRHYAAA